MHVVAQSLLPSTTEPHASNMKRLRKWVGFATHPASSRAVCYVDRRTVGVFLDGVPDSRDNDEAFSSFLPSLEASAATSNDALYEHELRVEIGAEPWFETDIDDGFLRPRLPNVPSWTESAFGTKGITVKNSDDDGDDDDAAQKIFISVWGDHPALNRRRRPLYLEVRTVLISKKVPRRRFPAEGSPQKVPHKGY